MNLIKSFISWWRDTNIISHPNRTFIHIGFIGYAYNTSHGSKKIYETTEKVHFAVGGEWTHLFKRLYYRSKLKGYNEKI